MALRAVQGKLAALTGRPRVQTRWVWGRHEQLRWAVFALKYLIFLVLPWLTVAGRPAVLFDLPARRYDLFGAVFWPQDFYLLGLFLAFAAVMLFFSTSLVSRSWCGFACPQTLLTSLFMQIDHYVEGDRPKRLALDEHHAALPALLRRALKHVLWLAVSAALGFTLTAYFVGAHALVQQVLTLTLGMTPATFWAFITGLTYLFAGHLRDWVCTTVCPYGRFQGAMQDADSLLVTYDASRGEPRGKGVATIARGGCVDCNQCVTVCPMGIDIRNGAQFECISCMRCIDACDLTMARVGAAPNLIRLASLNEVQAQAASPAAAWPVRDAKHWLRPRVLWYGAVLTGLVVALGTLTATRPMLGLEASRDRARVFALPDGRTSDFFQLSVLNKDTRAHVVTLKIEGLKAETLGLAGPVTLAAGTITALNASVLASHAPGAPRPFSFVMRDATSGLVLGTARASFVEPTP